MVKKLILIFACFSAFFSQPPCSTAGHNHAQKLISPDIAFGPLRLSTGELPGSEDGYVLSFTNGSQTLFRTECAFKIHETKIVPGIPRSSCKSMLSYCYSGGAHCCMSLIIATDCGSGTSLDMIDLAHGDSKAKFSREDREFGKAMEIIDWQFAYYGVENSELQLSFADSPGMTRLLVFDNGHWRADRVGELGRFYSPLLRQSLLAARAAAAKKDDPERTAAMAIQAAYYALMAGKPLEEAAATLRQLLPQKWMPESGRIIEDIRRAASDFDPVKVIW